VAFTGNYSHNKPVYVSKASTITIITLNNTSIIEDTYIEMNTADIST
jgi:hypothetical protein